MPWALSPYEWGHFAFQCGLPFRLVAHELHTVAGKVLAALVADSLQQDIPAAVAPRFKEVAFGICARQRVHSPQSPEPSAPTTCGPGRIAEWPYRPAPMRSSSP